MIANNIYFGTKELQLILQTVVRVSLPMNVPEYNIRESVVRKIEAFALEEQQAQDIKKAKRILGEK